MQIDSAWHIAHDSVLLNDNRRSKKSFLPGAALSRVTDRAGGGRRKGGEAARRALLRRGWSPGSGALVTEDWAELPVVLSISAGCCRDKGQLGKTGMSRWLASA